MSSTKARSHNGSGALLTSIALICSLGGALWGCNAASLKTPDSFVSMERVRSRNYFKAVSPDNAVITVSSFEHKDKGNLGYWTEILKREMTLRKGYTLKAVDPVKAKDGLEGRRLTFQTQSGTVKYLYAAHLFVTKKYIHVMETAAKEADYPKHQAAFDEALGSLSPR
ncbi:MAG: hypothetical protein RBU30_09290 [Polyangia bacterium]|jgi:hypothetical protein|nr:hypothetical protein [Polyangia bacterium]